MQANKTYIGIDPGLHGAISVLPPNEFPHLYEMPLLANVELDVKKILDIIDSYPNVHVTIEDVHSVFGASAAANFSFGFGCGSLFTILKLVNVPFTKVPPQTWQKEMWQGVRPVEIIVPGKKKKNGEQKYKVDTKATSLLAATRLFPNIDLRGEKSVEYYADNSANRKLNRVGKVIESKAGPHDGIIDALLMAEYGKRKNF